MQRVPRAAGESADRIRYNSGRLLLSISFGGPPRLGLTNRVAGRSFSAPITSDVTGMIVGGGGVVPPLDTHISKGVTLYVFGSSPRERDTSC